MGHQSWREFHKKILIERNILLSEIPMKSYFELIFEVSFPTFKEIKEYFLMLGVEKNSLYKEITMKNLLTIVIEYF